MKTCLLALFTLLLLTVISSAQPPDTMWTRAYGGTSFDEAYAVCAASDGGFVAVGRSRSFSAQFDYYAIRLNSMGDTLWTRTYGGTAYDHAYGVAEAANGGFIIIGSSQSYGAGSYDAYVVRINGSGDTLWTRTYGTTGVDFGYAIVSTTDGGWALAGSITVSGQSLNMMLTRIDDNGDIIWNAVTADPTWMKRLGCSTRRTAVSFWAGARFPRGVHGPICTRFARTVPATLSGHGAQVRTNTKSPLARSNPWMAGRWLPDGNSRSALIILTSSW